MNGGAKISIKYVLLHGDHFFLSAFSSSEVLGKNASIRSKLPTAACWSRKKREKGVKPTCFMSKATSVPQANYSQYSSPVEALNVCPLSGMIRPLSYIYPSRQKKSLQSYCSVDFISLL